MSEFKHYFGTVGTEYAVTSTSVPKLIKGAESVLTGGSFPHCLRDYLGIQFDGSKNDRYARFMKETANETDKDLRHLCELVEKIEVVKEEYPRVRVERGKLGPRKGITKSQLQTTVQAMRTAGKGEEEISLFIAEAEEHNKKEEEKRASASQQDPSTALKKLGYSDAQIAELLGKAM